MMVYEQKKSSQVSDYTNAPIQSSRFGYGIITENSDDSDADAEDRSPKNSGVTK
jgi:hypothetical protein